MIKEATSSEDWREHRKAINSEALKAFVAAGLTAEQGVIAIMAIVRGAIPAISIKY